MLQLSASVDVGPRSYAAAVPTRSSRSHKDRELTTYAGYIPTWWQVIDPFVDRARGLAGHPFRV